MPHVQTSIRPPAPRRSPRGIPKPQGALAKESTHVAACKRAAQQVFQTMLQGARLPQLSQQEIARYLGVSRSTVSGWSCGKSRMPSDYEIPLSRLMDYAQAQWVEAQQREANEAQVRQFYAHKLTFEAHLQHAAEAHAACVQP